MFNPNSAIDRIKNSLSYKLGLAIIEHKKQYKEWGYIVLLYKLYKIKQQYKKEQKLYKQTIKIFPHLAYPKVEFCKDYNESIKYKYHLSYMLGETLICAHKTWYKGGYFKLPSLLKEKYKLYKNIQDIISILPQNLHYHFYNSTIKNHKINIQSLVYILKQHKDYNPILENIFHNFDFFIKHFDLINTWLLSNDFKEKYKQENHPYPSLLDPKKLNDDNEKINYKNIPAELAWEMNLPLPDRYDFIWIRIWGCGNHSFAKMVSYYIDTNEFHFDFYYIYLNFYKKSKISQRKLMLHFVFFGNKNKNKFIKLIAKKVPILMITRDPISILKTWANHTGKNDAEKKEVHLNLDSNYGDFLKIKYLNYENYLFDGVDNPDIRNIKSAQKSFLYRDIVSSMEHSILYVKYVDIQEITVDNIHNILNSLLGFSFFKKNQKIQETINDMTIYLTRNRKLIYKNEIEIYITNNFNFRGLNNITHFLLNKNINNIIFAVDDCNLKKIIKSDSVENIREVIYDFLLKFNKAVCNEKEKHIKEQDILEYLLSNSSERRFYWDKINYDLVYLKKYRPDIIASWKYYQEFEKMCKELDGD